MSDRRHNFEQFGAGTVDEPEPVQYASFFFPDVGDLSLTFEDQRALQPDPTRKKVVLAVDFDIAAIDIIDKYGNTIELEYLDGRR